MLICRRIANLSKEVSPTKNRFRRVYSMKFVSMRFYHQNKKWYNMRTSLRAIFFNSFTIKSLITVTELWDFSQQGTLYGPYSSLSAKKSGKIATIGIGDGGNEIGMGKVHQMVVDGINNGQHIATTVATDHLITSGVSNWGGSALVAALAILSQCPVHSPYVRRGILPDTPVLTKEVLNTVEMVMPLMKSSFCVPNWPSILVKFRLYNNYWTQTSDAYRCVKTN